MRMMDFDHLKMIFDVREFDPELFILIINTFTAQVLENSAFNNKEE